jgi:hypothetical protein
MPKKNNIIRNFLKIVTPDFIKAGYRKLRMIRNQYRLNKKKWEIINYLKKNFNEEDFDEKKEIVAYLKENHLTLYPYKFTNNYNKEDIIVYSDESANMKYVLEDNKRLYFKRSMSEEQIKSSYNLFRMEQKDVNCPHKYENQKFYVKPGDVVVDAGVAEGNFALSVVEKAKKLYLFEGDKEWKEALEMTFAPWKDKVEIISKFISDSDDVDYVTLDTYFSGEGVIDFLKADIEGFEPQLLKGAKNILSKEKPMKLVLCTYHRHNDAEILNTMLAEYGFKTEFSKGYMIFYPDETLSVPYLRRCLIRASK